MSLESFVAFELGQQRALATILDAVLPRALSDGRTASVVPAEAQIIEFPNNKRPAPPFRDDADLPSESDISDGHD